MRGWSEILDDIISAAKASPAFAALSDVAIARKLSTATPLVQGAIRKAVRAGDVVPIAWAWVVVHHGPYRCAFEVATDALKIGVPGDSVRPNVSGRTWQEIADVLDLRVASAVILDAVQQQAINPIDVAGNKLPSRRFDGAVGSDLVRPITSSLGAMIEESQRVDELVDGGPAPGFLAGVTGKGWLPDQRLNDLAALAKLAAQLGYPFYGEQTAVNYGFFSRSGPRAPVTSIPPWKLYQGPGIAHDLSHCDYSQRGERLIKPFCQIGGGKYGTGTPSEMPVDYIANDPDTAGLYHYNGKPGPARHPWIPWCGSPQNAPAFDAPPGSASCEVLGDNPGQPLDGPRRRVAPWLMFFGGIAAAFGSAAVGRWTA